MLSNKWLKITIVQFSRSVEKDIKIPLPPKVTLNDHNNTDVHKVIYQTYGWENNDENKPYRILGKSHSFGIMHDATTYWVKQTNIMMIRAVSSDFDSIKAPFSFRNVPSLTGTNDAFTKETRNKL